MAQGVVPQSKASPAKMVSSEDAPPNAPAQPCCPHLLLPAQTYLTPLGGRLHAAAADAVVLPAAAHLR